MPLVKIKPNVYINTEAIALITFDANRQGETAIQLIDGSLQRVSEAAGDYLLESMDTRRAIVLPGEQVPEGAFDLPALTHRIEGTLRNQFRGATAAQLEAILQSSEREIADALRELLQDRAILVVPSNDKSNLGIADLYYSIYNRPLAAPTTQLAPGDYNLTLPKDAASTRPDITPSLDPSALDVMRASGSLEDDNDS
jgi:hypothetical protein